MKFFAGPRDDPFFWLRSISSNLGGTATAFKTQVWILCRFKCISVVEVPKAMLGTASTLNVWAETKKKTIINYS
jgi:hypothetical protein